MQKYYILAAVAAFLNIASASASNLIDSIGVENLKGKKVIIHKVVQHDTYYSIGRLYNVAPKEIITFNDNKYLQIGVIIKVPTNLPFKEQAGTTVKNTAAGNSAENGTYTEYTIQAKDNLNRLAERFGTTVNEIKRINELSSINLKIGQVLKMPAQAGTEPKQEQRTEQKPEQKQEQKPARNAGNDPIFPSKRGTEAVETTVAETGTYIEHVVKAKENLNMLAEKYGTSIDEIKRLNGLNSSNLRIAQVLKIPAKSGVATQAENKSLPEVVENTPKAAQKKSETAQKSAPPDNSAQQEEFIEHTVASNETIYSIATKYGLTMDQLKAKNNLPDNSLRVGQKLLIKGQYPVKKPYVAEKEEEADTLSSIKNPSLRYAASRYGLNQIEEKGTAVWIAEEGLDPSKMLVLHRTAPIGTVIKITNPMSNRSTFAKVVGKFTENESTKDVIIVMTKAVADALGALDKRFFCNLTYSGQDTNEQ